MSYLNRAWMAASVAVVNGHTDQGCKLKSGLQSLQHGTKRFSSSAAGAGGVQADFRPLSCMTGSGMDGLIGSMSGEERRKQADDSLRQVMYLSCWGPS